MYCNKSDLAEILGVSERTLTDWQDEGMPISGRGRRGQENTYDSAAVFAWKIERELAKVRADTPRDSLDRAKRKLIRIEIAEKRRSLVSPGEVEREWKVAVNEWTRRLQQIPALFADCPRNREVIESAINAALAELRPFDAAELRARALADAAADVCAPGPGVSDEARN